MRKVFGLLALLTALGVLVVPASAAAEEIVVEGGTVLVEPAKPSAMSPLAKSECSANTMCVWSNNDFTGNFSQWPESNTGCHNHESNPKLRSGWNRTNFRVRIGGAIFLLPGETFVVLSGANPITGEICWPA